MSTRRRLLLGAILCAACTTAPAASAAGPPLPSQQSGSAGVIAPGGTERYITRRAGPDTQVSAVRRSDGSVLFTRTIHGRWTVPAVTVEGGTTGLSADGGTLVLARPTRDYPPQATHLAILDARRLEVRREIGFPGLLTVDAISPDGRWVYVIQYANDDPLDYRVRAMDSRSGRLAAGDVVDPRNPDEQMGGLPMTRATSRDGRWAYTLYGGGEETFIHALDTAGRTAACIDLDMLPPQSDLGGVKLRVTGGGERIDVRDHGTLVATVDARTFAVTESAAPRQPAPPADGGDDGIPWAAVLIAAAAAAVGAAALMIARRRSIGSPTT
jgi:hypothetical protein